MFMLIAMYLFFVGLAFGSFALAMVDRMKAGKDWVRGRSACDSCGHVLHARDLVPVLSWLRTKGTCGYCGVKLSVSYPLTELVTGLAFVTSFVFWPHSLNSAADVLLLVVWLFAVVLMVGLFLFDIRWFLLPNKLVYPLILSGVVWVILRLVQQGFTLSAVVDVALAVGVGAGVFLALFIGSSGKWIGDGDIRFGVAIGLFTGVWTQAWLTIFLASLIGLVVAVPVILKPTKKKKKKLQLKIPFGPMLIIALFITVLFGAQIIDWYTAEILLL